MHCSDCVVIHAADQGARACTAVFARSSKTPINFHPLTCLEIQQETSKDRTIKVLTILPQKVRRTNTVEPGRVINRIPPLQRRSTFIYVKGSTET